MTLLDVVFAEFYFVAISGALHQPANAPSSWIALFEARNRPNVDRIQFALAGMNAHINHDLALVLLQTDNDLHLSPSLNSPEHDDYEHVNGLLEAELPAALTFLATGILGELAQDTGKIGRLLAGWNVRKSPRPGLGFCRPPANLTWPIPRRGFGDAGFAHRCHRTRPANPNVANWPSLPPQGKSSHTFSRVF
jgi:hypothetical protein